MTKLYAILLTLLCALPVGAQNFGAPNLKFPPSSGRLYSDASNPVLIKSLLPVNQVNLLGDSYLVDWGASSPYTGITFLLQRDTPAPVMKWAVGGATAPTTAIQSAANYIWDPSRPSASLVDGGANDGTADNCSSTFPTFTNCTRDYFSFMSFAVANVAIPANHRIMASAATISGGWVAQAGIYAVQGVTAGTPEQSATTGNTLTFAVPSSTATRLGINYQVTNSSAVTFTVNVDGTNVNNPCTGTTTWNAKPCVSGGMFAGSQSPTTAPYRQSVSVTPGSTHTVIITASAAGLQFDAVDYGVSGAPAAGGNNLVFVMGPNVNFALPTVYDYFTGALVTELSGQGLPVYFLDQQSTSAPGPGVNGTTDISTSSTASCPASTKSGHPNDCGFENMRKMVQAGEIAAGYVFSFTQSGYPARNPVGPLNVMTPTDNTGNLFNTYNRMSSYNTTTTKYDGGEINYEDVFVIMGVGAGLDSSSGTIPSSGRYTNRMWGATYNAMFNCDQWLTITAPTTTSPRSFAEASFASTNCTRPFNGDGWRKGLQAYAEGATLTVTGSNQTVAPAGQILHMAGTGSIQTITQPGTLAFTTSTNQSMEMIWIADAAWTTVTGGNINNAVTAVAGQAYDLIWTQSTGKWYITPIGGTTSGGASGTFGQSTSTNAAITSTSLVSSASTTPSMYQLNWTISLSAVGVACTGPAVVTLNDIFTDPNASGTVTNVIGVIPITIAGAYNGTLGYVASGTESVLLKNATSLNYSTGYSNGAGCSTQPKYQVSYVYTQIH